MIDLVTVALLADRLGIALADLCRNTDIPRDGPLHNLQAVSQELDRLVRNASTNTKAEDAEDGRIRASVTIDMEAESVRDLHDVAFARYVEANEMRTGYDLRSEFEEMYGPASPSADITGLARLVFDSGRHMPGVTVQDSFATIRSAPAA